MKHQGTIRIETDNLILRKFKLEDAEEKYQNWTSEEEVTKYLAWPVHANVDASSMVLQEWITNYSKPDFYRWGIE